MGKARPAGGRPTAAAAADRLRAIMAIAAEVFLEDGFDAASVSAIARRAGASKETLYARYASKEELFQAVILHKTEVLLEQLSLALEPGKAVRAVLEGYARRLLDLILAPETLSLHRTVVAAAPRFPRLAKIYWDSCLDREPDQLAEYLAAQVSAGRLAPCDPRQAAEAFFDLCTGRIHMRALLHPESPPTTAARSRHAARAVDAFLAAHGVDRR